MSVQDDLQLIAFKLSGRCSERINKLQFEPETLYCRPLIFVPRKSGNEIS